MFKNYSNILEIFEAFIITDIKLKVSQLCSLNWYKVYSNSQKSHFNLFSTHQQVGTKIKVCSKFMKFYYIG